MKMRTLLLFLFAPLLFSDCVHDNAVDKVYSGDTIVVHNASRFVYQNDTVNMSVRIFSETVGKDGAMMKVLTYYVNGTDTLAVDSTSFIVAHKTIEKETDTIVFEKNKEEFLDAEETKEKKTECKLSVVSKKENCFIVISKKELKLYVCEAMKDDTVRVAEYPVCMGKNLGQKEKKGDMRTPESTWENPFTITEIKNASNWCHNFGDGRGDILAYGNWFMRLSANGFSGIGIHGSTNNESSVPGRASEGCIRLLNSDLDDLKTKYAFKEMRVVIKSEEEDLRPFENKYYN